MQFEMSHHLELEDLAASLQKSHEQEIRKEQERHAALLETARIEFWCEVAREQVILISSKEAHDQIEAWIDVMDSMHESHEDELLMMQECHRKEMLEQQRRYEDIIEWTCAAVTEQKEQIEIVVAQEAPKEQITEVETPNSHDPDELALEFLLRRPCPALKSKQIAEPIESIERNKVFRQEFLAPKQMLSSTIFDFWERQDKPKEPDKLRKLL